MLSEEAGWPPLSQVGEQTWPFILESGRLLCESEPSYVLDLQPAETLVHRLAATDKLLEQMHIVQAPHRGIFLDSGAAGKPRTAQENAADMPDF